MEIILIGAVVAVVLGTLTGYVKARKGIAATTEQQADDRHGRGPYRSAPVLYYQESDVEEQNSHELQAVGVPINVLIPIGYRKTLYTSHITMAWKFDQVLYDNKVLVQTRLGNYVMLKYDTGKWTGDLETKEQAAVELLKRGFDLPEDLREAAMENLV